MEVFQCDQTIRTADKNRLILRLNKLIKWIKCGAENGMMGTIITNNLLNGFIYKKFPTLCPSPTCPCNLNTEQTAIHIVLECPLISQDRRQRNRVMLEEAVSSHSMQYADCVTLLNGSRSTKFIEALVGHLEEDVLVLRKKIILPKKIKPGDIEDLDESEMKELPTGWGWWTIFIFVWFLNNWGIMWQHGHFFYYSRIVWHSVVSGHF